MERYTKRFPTEIVRRQLDVEMLRVADRARLRDRIRARLFGRRLDSTLATGVSPEASPALALRARFLVATAQRRAMADAFRRLVGEARGETGASRTRIAAPRRNLVAAESELRALAEQLRTPGPVAARGAAQAWLLLGDGTGPLYNSENRHDLCAQAAAARVHLRVPMAVSPGATGQRA